MIKWFLFLFLISCSNHLMDNDELVWDIENLIVELDRQENELYIQVEISNNLHTLDSIDSVMVNLEYVAGNNTNYDNSFLLYDNGENGDIIANNGIYTLIVEADVVSIPDEQSEIISIDFPTSFRIDSTEPGFIPFTVTIRGKKYLATANLFTNGEVYTVTKYMNIDNTLLDVKLTKNNLYLDNYDTLECDRTLGGFEDGEVLYPDPDYYDIEFDMGLDANSLGSSNYFIYESGFSVTSMNECASTGLSKFKFTLSDLDNNESDSEERTIVIFGCGDGICEGDYESITSCPGDCVNE